MKDPETIRKLLRRFRDGPQFCGQEARASVVIVLAWVLELNTPAMNKYYNMIVEDGIDKALEYADKMDELDMIESREALEKI